MLDKYLDNIPYDLLNIIFHYIKPSIKYKLNKEYFLKYYHIRFNYINNSVSYLKHINTRDIYTIKNYNYIKYLIKYDTIMIIKYIIDTKHKNDKTFYIIKKPIIFENNKYKNFIDLCKYYSDKFKTQYIKKYINTFIIMNNVSITNSNSAVLSQTKCKKGKNKNKIWIA